MVHHLPEDEVYQDIARIPGEYRVDRRGEAIERGIVCRLYCEDTGKEAFVVLYGSRRDGAHIGIDNRTRTRLGVKPDTSYEFDLSRGDFCSEVRWALDSGDITHRFSSKIALVSLGLGLLGAVLGVVALVVSRR